MIPQIALPRGATLLEEAAEGARSFAVGFWFPLGSRHEAAAERGFVHFVEHMVFKGSARRSAQDFAREVDRVGGYLNAFTERDTLCFHCVVPAGHWRLALDILVDLVFCASFPEEEFERERRVIESEILSAGDDPEEASHDSFLPRIWPGDPLSLKIAGEIEDLAGASRDRLYAFYKRRLRPELLTVSVSGPTEGLGLACELSALLDALPPFAGGCEPYPAEPSPRFVPARGFEAGAISQVYLYEAVEILDRGRPDDYYGLCVLNGALGESMSSRLFQKLREREGLCYSVYSTFSMDRGVGLWMASASSSAKLFPRLLQALDRELDLLSTGEGALTEAEVGESVSRIAGSFELAMEDPEYRMKRLAKQRLCTGEVLTADETRARILAVTPEEVEELAARLFAGRPRARFGWGRRSLAIERVLAAPLAAARVGTTGGATGGVEGGATANAKGGTTGGTKAGAAHSSETGAKGGGRG
jgi:predicted Zn-dependent peptidase